MVAFLKEKDLPKKRIWGAILGFVTGLGPYTFHSWVFPAFLIVIGAFGGSFQRPFKNRDYIPWFLAFFLAALTPYFIAAWRENFNAFSRVVYGLSGGVLLKDRFQVAFSYFSTLFWGALSGVRVWNSDNWERFNPLWGAAFFLGMIQMVKHRAQRMVQWLGLALIICFFPGLISPYVETFRILPILPFLLLVTAWGLGSLLMKVSKDRRILLLSVFLAVSAGIDGNRVIKIYGLPMDFAGNPETSAPVENLRAYRILKEIRRQAGDGLIFTEFFQDAHVRPFVMTYDINAAENPRLDARAAKWAAVLLDSHYKPFLSKKFPEAHWYPLGWDLPDERNITLGVIPVQERNKETLGRWIQAHHYFRQLDLLFGNIGGSRSYALAEKTLDQRPSFLNDDRFLESCYWELHAEFYYRYNYQNHYEDMLFDLRQAIEKGYPSAHLYYKSGSLLLRKSRFVQSREAFQGALREEPHYAQALDALSILDRLEKQKNAGSPDQTAKTGLE